MANLGVVDSAITALQSTISTIASGMGRFGSTSPLVPLGQDLLLSISFMLIVWAGFKALLEGTGPRQVIATIISIMLMSGIATLLIQDDNYFQIKIAIVKSVNTIAEQLQGPSSLTSNVMGVPSSSLNQDMNGQSLGYDGLFKGLSVILNAIANIWEAVPPVNGSTSQPTGTSSMSLWDMLRDGPSSTLADAIISFFMKLFITVFLILDAVIVTFYFIYSQILIAIAFLLGPIFIPFMVWEQAFFLFSGWVSFFIKALMYKLVGLTMIVLMSDVILQAIQAMNNRPPTMASGNWGFDFFTYMGVMLISTIYAFMFLMIPEIASGLVGGGPSAPGFVKAAGQAAKMSSGFNSMMSSGGKASAVEQARGELGYSKPSPKPYELK